MIKKQYNWAILGCGHIAHKFASDLKLLPEANLYAAASRDLNRAQNFAAEFGFDKAYGSYDALVNDSNVDVVYIATPHSYHYEHTLLCLNHKKAVLCEKAFSLNATEVKEMIACAEENHVFLMEAFWTMFQPSFRQAMAILQSGELGKIKMVRSDLAFHAPFDPERRLYNIRLGGGSLLDIGIYPVFAAITSLGVPQDIKSFADFSSTGVEETISMLFHYQEGAMAVLTSSFACDSSTQTEYACENGYLILNRKWFTPTDITMLKEGGEPKKLPKLQHEGFGYQYEARHLMECLEAGLIESPVMNWKLSIDLMTTLDRVRKDAKIIFPDRD